MPVIGESTYRPPWYLRDPHWQTVLPNVTRRRLRIEYVRQRVELRDSDFIDIDWLRSPGCVEADRCCVALHGLEGSSRASYMKSLAMSLAGAGYAVAAMNLRGCSGEPNRLRRSYHSGDSDSLANVVESVSERYGRVCLAGFSLGGNIVLKYLGEGGSRIPGQVKAAIAISTPCDLRGSAERLANPGNAFYMKRFIRMLCAKLKAKEERYRHFRYQSGCAGLKTFREFDDAYTAPLNGFKDADDYWTQCSGVNYLDGIKRPTLLINARNDPFLSEGCYPDESARRNSMFHLETPEEGGHCGFPGRRRGGGYWHERRALSFFEERL